MAVPPDGTAPDCPRSLVSPSIMTSAHNGSAGDAARASGGGSPPIIVWFRRNLRLHDNPALPAAARNGAHILSVYIHAPDEERTWTPGSASHWWLHHSLAALDDALRSPDKTLYLAPFAVPALRRAEPAPDSGRGARTRSARQPSRLASSLEGFLRELGWREFSHHLLYHFPDTAQRSLDERFELVPWNANMAMR